jgi:hypothetical protein
MKKQVKRHEEKRIVKGVYLDPSTVEELKIEARKERRSLSGQMSLIIENWLSEARNKGTIGELMDREDKRILTRIEKHEK